MSNLYCLADFGSKKCHIPDCYSAKRLADKCHYYYLSVRGSKEQITRKYFQKKAFQRHYNYTYNAFTYNDNVFSAAIQLASYK